MQIIGIILIIITAGLYGLWIWYTKNQHAVVAKESGGVQEFEILVKGVYSPSVIKAAAGRAVRIKFRREETTECSRYVNFPDFKIRKELPEGQTVAIEFMPKETGEFMFTCDMSMYRGRLIVE